MSGTDERQRELVSIRDWLRYAVSRFNEAGLVYGHGTGSALDEAAFLILSALSLPIDVLEPWLDARLVGPERARLDALIEARVTTRKPAPYLVGAAYIRGRRFRCDERAIVPRSYIGELLAGRLDGDDDVFAPLDMAGPVRRVLDLCTGGGSLAVLAAQAFPDAEVDAVDISGDALALAAENVADWELQDRVRLLEGDLWQPLRGQRYDLILANPPYVTAAAVAAFPPEYRAEPVGAHLGGADGLDLVRRIIDGAGAHIEDGGQLVIEVGTGRERLIEAYPDLPFLWLDTEGSSGEVAWLAAGDLAGGATDTGR